MISTKLYRDYHELPLSRFTAILKDGDLKHLIKRKGLRMPDIKAMQDLWSSIFYDYMHAVRDTQYIQTVTLTRELVANNLRYQVVENVVTALCSINSPELIKVLRSLGFNRFKYSPSDPEKYAKELRITLSQAKKFHGAAKTRQRELDNLQKKTVNSEKKQDFESLLVELSKFQGYRINPDKTSLAEFAAILRKYREYVEKLSNNGRKNR